MLIAHLPAGYLLASRIARHRPHRGALVVTGLIASILPDLDLFWFYLVDGRQTLHHAYPSHWPLFWVSLALLAVAVGWFAHLRRIWPFVGVALACLLLHMALDSIAAGIGWLQPFHSGEINLVKVPARYDWWVWSFVLHWTFLLEIAICVVAAFALWTSEPRRIPRA